MSDIGSAVQAILGSPPKPSLLFGAPAVALRQLEGSLEITAGGIRPEAILVELEEVNRQIFAGRKRVEIKRLTRLGKQETWIVFRPGDPGSAVPAEATTAARVGLKLQQPPLPAEPKAKPITALQRDPPVSTQASTPHAHNQDIVLDIKGQDGPSERDAPRQGDAGYQSKKSKLLRQFRLGFKASSNALPPSSSSTDEQTAGIDRYAAQCIGDGASLGDGDIEIVLPPAHRIGSGDFGSLWIPHAGAEHHHIAQHPQTHQPTRTHPHLPPPSRQPLMRSRNTPDQPLIDTKSTSRFPAIRPTDVQQIPQTYIPVDLPSSPPIRDATAPLSRSTSLGSGKEPSNLPATPRRQLRPPPLRPQGISRPTPRSTSAAERYFEPESSMKLERIAADGLQVTLGSDESDVDLVIPPPRSSTRLSITPPYSSRSTSSSRSRRVISPSSGSASSRASSTSPQHDHPVQPVRSVSSRHSSRPSPPLAPARPRRGVSPRPSLSSPPPSATFQPRTRSSQVEALPETTPLWDPPSAPTGSPERGPATPWLEVAFHGLPFGTDVPAFHIARWVQDRWQVLGAEMIVLLSAVYILQILSA